MICQIPIYFNQYSSVFPDKNIQTDPYINCIQSNHCIKVSNQPNMASFITIISFVLFIALSANGLVIKPRIVGGNDAEMNQFPYNVGLFMDSDNAKMIVCGGAIIGERHILSSGACGKAVEEELHKFVAILGTPEYDGMMIQIKIDKVHLHPRFKIESLKNDLAMLRTAKKMCFFDLVRPIALPVVDLESDDGVSAVVTSWGFLNVSF